MNTYVIRRRDYWGTPEQLQATAEKSAQVGAEMSDDIRWIRSYVVQEEDGSFSGYCVYEASGPDALRRHGEAMKLPTDAIKPVVSTIVVSGDPEPIATV